MDREALLAWYSPRRRAYPWRARPTPYRVLVSEIMLQQTQAARVEPAFRAFIRRFPSAAALARARRSEVLRAWAGLGYNRRAVALSRAARAIVREHRGRVPRDPAVLQGLPGVGPYTAAAVASIAFGVPAAAVDANVARVVTRVHLGAEAHEVPPAVRRDLARGWLDREDPGSWNQALMDLGREVCRPRPRCPSCPLAGACRFEASGREPAASGRRQPRFEGSLRQVRGRVIAALRERSSASLGALSRDLGQAPDRIHRAIAGLAADGLVEAGPAALAGRPGGRVRLSEEERGPRPPSEDAVA